MLVVSIDENILNRHIVCLAAEVSSREKEGGGGAILFTLYLVSFETRRWCMAQSVETPYTRSCVCGGGGRGGVWVCVCVRERVR